MNKVSNAISSIDEEEMKKIIIKLQQHIIIFKVHSVTDYFEKGGSRSEILIYTFPLYIAGNTRLVADYN